MADEKDKDKSGELAGLITAIWGVAKDAGTLAVGKSSTDLRGGNALPKVGEKEIGENELTWPSGNICSCRLPIRIPMVIPYDETEYTLWTQWEAGGTYHGHGLFVHNASMGCSVQNVRATFSLTVTGGFDPPSHHGSPDNPLAYLSGHIKAKMDSYEYDYSILCQGDGDGYIKSI